MLYEELKVLTDDKSTLEQYEVINEVYLSSEKMTHADAASLWKVTYGRSSFFNTQTEGVDLCAIANEYYWNAIKEAREADPKLEFLLELIERLAYQISAAKIRDREISEALSNIDARLREEL